DRIMIELQRDQQSGADLASHQKCRLIDDSLSRDGRRNQGVTVVGFETSLDRDHSLAITTEGPTIRTDGSRQRVAQASVLLQIGDRSRTAMRGDIRRRRTYDRSTRRKTAGSH